MLCIPIVGPSFEAAFQQIEEASIVGDLLELRLDLLTDRSFLSVEKLRHAISKPVIFTLRAAKEEKYLKEIVQLTLLKPDYWDFDYLVDTYFSAELKKIHPALKIIFSHHNWDETPSDLEALLEKLPHYPQNALYKIACMASNAVDGLRLLNLVKQHPSLIGVAMGEKGSFTRLLAPPLGSPWSYFSLGTGLESAPGQITAQEVRSLYGALRKGTPLYGLIGNPVTYSPSQYTHNKVMRELNLKGLYVKMEVESDNLKSFIHLIQELNWKGMSVTLPFKEAILSCIDSVDPEAQEIGAVNTLLFQDQKIKGYNTDGKGALDAIEKQLLVKDKEIAILGAGGASRAIIYEAKKRGAHVTVYNRTLENAERVGRYFNVAYAPLTKLEPHYDIIINTTPHPEPIEKALISPSALVMDIKTIPKLSPFLKQAQEKGCRIVYGYEMFLNQAVAQFALWFPGQFDKQTLHTILLNELLQRI